MWGGARGYEYRVWGSMRVGRCMFPNSAAWTYLSIPGPITQLHLYNKLWHLKGQVSQYFFFFFLPAILVPHSSTCILGSILKNP